MHVPARGHVSPCFRPFTAECGWVDTRCLSLMAMWVVSAFWLGRTLVYKVSHGRVFPVLLGVYLAVQFLGHR